MRSATMIVEARQTQFEEFVAELEIKPVFPNNFKKKQNIMTKPDSFWVF